MEPNDYIKLIIKAYKNSIGHFVPGVYENLDTFHELFRGEIISFQKTYNKNNFVSELHFFTQCLIALEKLEETVEYYPYILSNKIYSEIKLNKENNKIINVLEQQLEDISFDKIYFPIDQLGIGMDGNIDNGSIKIMLDIIDDLRSNALNIITEDGFISDDLDSNLSISEKIVYLQKLGIIDFLYSKQPFNTSINLLSTIVANLINSKTTTVQPYLNSMVKKDVAGKNNPLNNIKTVERVENKLNQINFKL